MFWTAANSVQKQHGMNYTRGTELLCCRHRTSETNITHSHLPSRATRSAIRSTTPFPNNEKHKSKHIFLHGCKQQRRRELRILPGYDWIRSCIVVTQAMYLCIRTHIRTYTHSCIHSSIYSFIPSFTYSYIDAHMCIRMYACTYELQSKLWVLGPLLGTDIEVFVGSLLRPCQCPYMGSMFIRSTSKARCRWKDALPGVSSWMRLSVRRGAAASARRTRHGPGTPGLFQDGLLCQPQELPALWFYILSICTNIVVPCSPY